MNLKCILFGHKHDPDWDKSCISATSSKAEFVFDACVRCKTLFVNKNKKRGDNLALVKNTTETCCDFEQEFKGK